MFQGDAGHGGHKENSGEMVQATIFGVYSVLFLVAFKY